MTSPPLFKKSWQIMRFRLALHSSYYGCNHFHFFAFYGKVSLSVSCILSFFFHLSQVLSAFLLGFLSSSRGSLPLSQSDVFMSGHSAVMQLHMKEVSSRFLCSWCSLCEQRQLAEFPFMLCLQ